MEKRKEEIPKETRKEALINLVKFNGEISVLSERLNQFPWDSEEVLYTLQTDDILNVFTLLSNGLINVNTLEMWANAIECREDVEYENDTVQEVINELANPELYGSLSQEHIVSLKQLLS